MTPTLNIPYLPFDSLFDADFSNALRAAIFPDHRVSREVVSIFDVMLAWLNLAEAAGL